MIYIYIYIFLIAPPESPVDFQIKTCGNLNVTLIWKPGFDNYLNITHYIIYSKTSFDADFSKMTQTTGNINEVELKLSPYANYTFKISAVNQLGESVQSNVTNYCQTRAALPAYNPTGVKIQEDQTGKLVIEWNVSYLYELCLLKMLVSIKPLYKMYRRK